MQDETKTVVPKVNNPEADKAITNGDNGKKTFSFVGQENRGRRGGGRGGRGERPRSEFAQNMISIRRVARVVSGGRRFSFSVSMIVGDKKGRVGLGMGKAGDTALAIDKAIKQAKKRMITVALTKSGSIAREVSAKYASSSVFMKPAPGRGMVAGGSVRAVLDTAGVTDINAKLLSRSKNSFNNAKAALKALSSLK